jgi:hypothetical protein
VRQEYGKIALIFILVILTIGWMTDPLAAQIISGDLVGTVFDKTSAVVPDATVEATNADTGVTYETKSGDTGEYRFNNLPVGVYNISASTANFATTTINGFTVELNKTSTLLITLEVKGAATTVEVSGAAAALDTTTAQVQSTFESKDIADSAIAIDTRMSLAGAISLSLAWTAFLTSNSMI